MKGTDVPRLSLYRPHKSNDYKYFDRLSAEQFTVGGLEILIHKYLGPKEKPEGSGDATQPTYTHADPLFIEDLLFLENRDRKYDQDIYRLRGVFNVNDLDFDLSQFGLFIQGDTLFITWHYNDMIDALGRKLMNGDVLEIPNLKDFHPLDPNLPKGMPKYYVIQDASFDREGFSQTWMPHQWRTKAIPLVASQEFNDILKKPMDEENPEAGSLLDLLSTHNKNLAINEALIQQAEQDVPKSGYDVDKLYVLPTNEDGVPTSTKPAFGGNYDDPGIPRANGWTVGYLTGDGIPPNGLPVTPGLSFPMNPTEGDFALRLDYFPNRLFRYSQGRWIKVEDNVRNHLTNGPLNVTQRSNFVNNPDTVTTSDRGEIPSRQSLSEALRPKADN